MNSRVDPEVICGPLSDTASRDRSGLIIGTDVHPSVVVAGIHGLQQPLGLQGVGEAQFDLGGGFPPRRPQ